MTLALPLMMMLAAQTPAPAAPPADGAAEASTDDGQGVDNDELEFVEGNDTPQDLPQDELPPVEPEEVQDKVAPTIDDLAIAATNPISAPVVTAVFSDDNSGIDTAYIYVRPVGSEAFKQVAFDAGEGGMFMTVLPLGTQETGFDYYVEVKDAAGNGPTRIGSEEAPLRISAAGPGALEDIRQSKMQKDGYAVHPAWAMLSLGIGVVGLAGAAGMSGIAVSAVDVQQQWAARAQQSGNTEAEQREAERMYADATNAIIIDSGAAALLGIVGVSAVATGVTLLVINGMDE